MLSTVNKRGIPVFLLYRGFWLLLYQVCIGMIWYMVHNKYFCGGTYFWNSSIINSISSNHSPIWCCPHTTEAIVHVLCFLGPSWVIVTMCYYVFTMCSYDMIHVMLGRIRYVWPCMTMDPRTPIVQFLLVVCVAMIQFGWVIQTFETDKHEGLIG